MQPHIIANNVMNFIEISRTSKVYLFIRRFIEILSIILFSPLIALLLIATAALVYWEFGKDVFFIQQRVGKYSRSFSMIKFRSMKQSGDSPQFQLTTEFDDRITPIGAFIRKMRLDELPQFYHVLVGQMSIIGPRPIAYELYEELSRIKHDYDMRHTIAPGLTGYAQVTLGYTDSIDGELEKWEKDVFYIQNISLKMDCVVIIKTIKVLLSGFGAR